EELHSSVIGQHDAVSAVARAVRRSRTGMANANRPIATFMFLGPTGVGKTELAKALATNLFGKSDALIRIDMSEYGEKHTVARL
ncbi:AAA family ATPase, partial [Acinetobacter baumannii]